MPNLLLVLAKFIKISGVSAPSPSLSSPIDGRDYRDDETRVNNDAWLNSSLGKCQTMRCILMYEYTTLEFPSYTLELVITLNIPSSLELRYSSGFHSYCITMGHILGILFSALMWKTTQAHRASDSFKHCVLKLHRNPFEFDIPDDPKKV